MTYIMEIRNKKAGFDYTFIDTYTAGIVLTGTEIKSIRLGSASLEGSFCYIKDDEVFIKMYIKEYEMGSYLNHEPNRDRKLLLNSEEIRKINKSMIVKGITIVPIKLFINERGLAKVLIAVAKGKKEYDKRQTIKGKDIDRELKRKGSF